MGGCAMIGQSMINVKSGGRTRIAGIAAALFLLSFILVAAPLIEQIPLAALVGVMFMVVIGTFAWNSLRIMTAGAADGRLCDCSGDSRDGADGPCDCRCW